MCTGCASLRTVGCTATYRYDPRDKLVREVNGHGATTDYTLDAAGNITRELVSAGAKDTAYAYTGQLTSVSRRRDAARLVRPHRQSRLHHPGQRSQPNCAPGSGGSYSAQVLADYSYDYLDRMTQYRSEPP